MILAKVADPARRFIDYEEEDDAFEEEEDTSSEEGQDALATQLGEMTGMGPAEAANFLEVCAFLPPHVFAWRPAARRWPTEVLLCPVTHAAAECVHL